MEQMKKIKVVWLCHFSNAEIRELYPRDQKRPIYHFVRKILGLSKKKGGPADFAPWVTGAIEEIKKRNDVELHVISPQTDLKGKTFQFGKDGVNYYFYNPNWTLFLMHIIKSNHFWRKLQNSSKYANRFIKKINPDIINLIGAENPYHSCAVLDLKVNVPVLITLQTFYTNPSRLKYAPDADKSKNWYIDGLIHQCFKYFTLTGKMYNDLLRKENPNVITFKFSFCGIPYPKINDVDKQYDFVNFAAGHGVKKGTTDSIEALAMVKKIYPQVTLNIVGGINSEDAQKIYSLVKDNHLEENVIFTSYFPEQKDMFQHIMKSRFAVLPIKMDIVSGTIIDAMYYGLPVVTYKTSGTPYLNSEKECVLIADLENVQQLAEKMLLLLNNTEEVDSLRVNAMSSAKRSEDNALKIDYLINDYRALLNHYYNHIPIPQELLFDENKIGL